MHRVPRALARLGDETETSGRDDDVAAATRQGTELIELVTQGVRPARGGADDGRADGAAASCHVSSHTMAEADGREAHQAHT
jgi:hypothetical protein